jgi:5-methyltetrahydropteroyltriglutamate--homocysteine methyltransferase
VVALQDAGAGFIQVNEPAIIKNAQDLPLISRALTVLMDGVTVETALYTWFGAIDGLYPQILDLPFDVIGLDFVMGRQNWQIIKSAAFTKKLGFGIIDARNTRMESEEYIIEKLKEISEIVPLDRVHLNPSCGLEYLPREVAQAKLTRMVAAARRAVEVLA